MREGVVPGGVKNRLASRAPLCCVAAMRSFAFFSLFALAPLAIGCGPGTATVSCEVGTADAGPAVTHSCTQYDNDPVDAVTAFDEACAGVPGNGCSITGVLGTCVIAELPVRDHGDGAVLRLRRHDRRRRAGRVRQAGRQVDRGVVTMGGQDPPFEMGGPRPPQTRR